MIQCLHWIWWKLFELNIWFSRYHLTLNISIVFHYFRIPACDISITIFQHWYFPQLNMNFLVICHHLTPLWIMMQCIITCILFLIFQSYYFSKGLYGSWSLFLPTEYHSSKFSNIEITSSLNNKARKNEQVPHPPTLFRRLNSICGESLFSSKNLH